MFAPWTPRRTRQLPLRSQYPLLNFASRPLSATNRSPNTATNTMCLVAQLPMQRRRLALLALRPIFAIPPPAQQFSRRAGNVGSAAHDAPAVAAEIIVLVIVSIVGGSVTRAVTRLSRTRALTAALTAHARAARVGKAGPCRVRTSLSPVLRHTILRRLRDCRLGVGSHVRDRRFAAGACAGCATPARVRAHKRAAWRGDARGWVGLRELRRARGIAFAADGLGRRRG